MDLNKKIKDSFEKEKPKAPKDLWTKLSHQLDEGQVNHGLDKKIKDSFQQQTPKTPQGLWSKLSDQLDQSDVNLDEKIKKSFQEQGAKAPKQIWEGINKQLTIQSVWKRISLQLDKQPIITNWAGRMLRFSTVAAIILLFAKSCLHTDLTTSSGLEFAEHLINTNKDYKLKSTLNNKGTLNPVNSPLLAKEKESFRKETETITNSTDVIERVKENSVKTTNPTKATANLNNSKAKKENQKQNITLPSSASVEDNKLVIPNLGANAKMANLNHEVDNKMENVEKELTINSSTNLTKVASESDISVDIYKPVATIVADSVSPTEMVVLSPEVELISPSKKRDVRVNKKWELGLVYNLQSTVFLNPETRESLDRNSLSTTNLAPSNSYGVMLNYRINKRHTASLEWFVNAEAKQSYGVYIEGRHYIRKVQLNYTKAAINHNYYIYKTKGKMPSTTYLKTGGYFSILTHKMDKYQRQDSFLEFAEAAHSRWDFGLRVGVGQDLQFGRVLVGMGIQAELGLNNIFKGTQHIPAAFNRTNIFNIGGSFSIRYLL
ncbi:MAG: hypothetical protein GY810_24685 [Aureispira sp.]|nr:hypothetical protein [Aureispira sp.]